MKPTLEEKVIQLLSDMDKREIELKELIKNGNRSEEAFFLTKLTCLESWREKVRYLLD